MEPLRAAGLAAEVLCVVGEIPASPLPLSLLDASKMLPPSEPYTHMTPSP